jgi:transposase InsO family protein
MVTLGPFETQAREIHSCTYLRTGLGWLYLAAVRDGRSRRVIGWAIADTLCTAVVETALSMAIALRWAMGRTR